MNTIVCPHCSKQFEISSAITGEIEKEIVSREKNKHALEIEELQKKAQLDSEEKVKKQFSQQLKRAQEESVAQDERNKQLIEQITQLTKDMRQLRVEKDETKLIMEKKLAEEEEKIRVDATKKAEESQHLKLLEKEKQLQDALRSNEDMRRKLTQGSQQTQGEAFEEEFEQLLQNKYHNDKVFPVGKGIKGGDIVQEVWDSNGNFTGKIIWELKNTKTWSELWVDKVKVDKRSVSADEAVIITEAMPPGITVAGYHNGVWVTQRNFVFPLTDSLRARLIHVHLVKNSLKGKDMKMEALYNYLTGAEFKNRIEAIVESFSGMQTEIEKEKRYFTNKWARDEKNIRQVIDSTYGMHGDLKGILAGVIPQIKGMDIMELVDGKDKEQSNIS